LFLRNASAEAWGPTGDQDTALFKQAFEGVGAVVPSVRRVEGVMKALAFTDTNALYYTVGTLTFLYLAMWLLIKVRPQREHEFRRAPYVWLRVAQSLSNDDFG
jgi:hypothetical protein